MFKKIKERLSHNRCYKFMNKHELRVYIKSGICAGTNPYGYGSHLERCLKCPYFLDIRDNDDWS